MTLSQKLYDLADQMFLIAEEIEQQGRPFKAKELRGAASIVQDWAANIHKEETE